MTLTLKIESFFFLHDIPAHGGAPQYQVWLQKNALPAIASANTEIVWSIVLFQKDALTTFWPLYFVQICTNSVPLPHILFYPSETVVTNIYNNNNNNKKAEEKRSSMRMIHDSTMVSFLAK